MTIKTIKPDATGDFTTLQAWENWDDDQASADQWAECYTGGDLGTLVISSWTSTPDATHYPRVYTLLTERHNGTILTGAYINASSAHGIQIGEPISGGAVNYVHVEGIRINVTENKIGICIYSHKGVGFSSLSDNAFILDNLVYYGSAVVTPDFSNDNAIKFSADTVISGSISMTVTIVNNIVYCNNSYHGIILNISPSVGGDITLNSTVYSNSVKGANNTGIRYYINPFRASGVHVSNLKNNISVDSGVKDYGTGGSGTWTITALNNLSSDATADDFGGTGYLLNKTSTNQFINPVSNWNLLSTADALDAGVTLSSPFDIDAVGISRPRGAGFDMGALEFISFRRRVIITEP
jgi:hypothetical protein